MAMVCVTLMGNFEVRLQPLVVTIGTAEKSGATDMATGITDPYTSLLICDKLASYPCRCSRRRNTWYTLFAHAFNFPDIWERGYFP